LLVIGYDAIEYASLTDTGVRRSHNQDAHATLLASDAEQWRERGHVFLVADGMGAHAVGELASDMAVRIIPHTYHKYAAQTGVPALRKAFVEANATIHAKGQQNPDFGGMGTTTTALLLRPEGAWIGHVGDSRAYRIRDGQIEQISFDHSLVWEMARRQGVDPERLQGIPSNVIVRSLGPEPLVQVDVEGPHKVQAGDLFLLCSDGLSGQVSDREIGAIASVLPPAEACRFLIDLANLRGGPDNITVLIVRVNEPAAPPQTEPKIERSWIRLAHWPLISLVAGLVLVVGAAWLTADGYRSLGLLVFIVAAPVILAGVAGLFVAYNRENRVPVAEDHSRPHIYRQAPCVVEQSLLDKVMKAIEALVQQVKDRNWEVEWDDFQGHYDRSRKLLGEGNVVESFRESCRAMRYLADAVQRQRPKGEAVPALWDKE
jgi:PPM family protein phosphatase